MNAPQPVDVHDYRTHDLGLAAFLVASGHPLLRVLGPRGGQRHFVFDYAAIAIAPSYFRNAPVSARAMMNAIRDLKALVISGT